MVVACEKRSFNGPHVESNKSRVSDKLVLVLANWRANDEIDLVI